MYWSKVCKPNMLRRRNILKIGGKHMSENFTVLPEAIYDVYARIDNKNRVVKIFSTCFEQPQDGDFLIKSGTGDEFVHTGYYRICTENGAHRYRISSDNMLREATEDEIELELLPYKKLNRITELKNKLSATDYVAMKYAEGWINDEEYSDIKAQRQVWRDEVNQLEAEIISLEE